MAQLALSIGVPYTMAQNVEYALPARLVHVTSSLAMEISVNGVAWNVLTGVNTVGAYTSAAFVRCTTGSPTVLCKL